MCYDDDWHPTGNIGPLFVSESMTIKDDKKRNCLKVSSLSEGPQKLTSHIFPGIHYCKLISPARFVDYITIDGVKSKTTCMNHDAYESEYPLEAFLE